MTVRRRGLLLALEGIDGAGKSTLTTTLLRSARARGLRAVARREPSDPEIGRLAQEAGRGDAWTGAVYFTVDRALARPRLVADLDRNELVVSDRSFYSTLAYQGSALGREGVRRLEALSCSVTVAPDRVVLLDLPPAEAIRRLGARGGRRGPLERRAMLEQVARQYRRLARTHGWTVLDARAPTPELEVGVWRALPPALRRDRRRRT